MLRKATLFSLAMFLVLAGMVTVASAAQNVANVSQKGSLLIWPKIVVQDSPYVDTYLMIGNDYYQDVWVKCYWVDSDQNIEDFMFRLTPNQPIEFSARNGSANDNHDVTIPPFAGLGELKCWAVNAQGTQQISWNHLYGDAIIAGGYLTRGAAMYNAWSFTARNVALGNSVGTIQGKLELTGGNNAYDACPQYLVTNFHTNFNMLDYADLTLVPCMQDLRQDRLPTCTKAKFDIWNENETKYTGAYQCLKCWWEGYLEDIGKDASGFGGEKFTLGVLKTLAARFRVQSASNAACKAAIPECLTTTGVLTPFVGLLLYAHEEEADAQADDQTGFVPFTGTTPFGAGSDGTGFIYWDPAGGSPEAPTR
jgi:hypothetical protein